MVSPLHTLSLADILEEHRRSRPDHVAAIHEDRRYSYPQLADRVIRLANALEDAGVARGDRILWLAQNSHGVLEGIVAAGKLGAMFCPINWRQTADEMAFVIDDLEPKVVVWQDDRDRRRGAQRTRGGVPSRRVVAFARRRVRRRQLRALRRRRAQRENVNVESDPDLPALIIYTAAFGGRPNGAMLSQTAMAWQDLALIDIQDLSADTVFLNSGPLFHVGTLMVTMAIFHIGGTNVFIRRTDTGQIAEAIHRHRCDYAFLMQSTCHELAELNRDRRYDFGRLRSASVSPEWDAMVTVVPARSLFGYGQTEVMGPVTWSYYGWGTNAGRNGRTGPGAQVRDPRRCRPRAAAGTNRRDLRARSDRDARLLAAARAERRTPARRLAPHARSRHGARPTARSASSARRRR